MSKVRFLQTNQVLMYSIMHQLIKYFPEHFFFLISGVTPKGVALLLNGLRSLRHVVYDVMSDVLTYIDFNTSDMILQILELRTILFHSMELLSSNHLELVSKLCPRVEWLSLDSALFYNLEGILVKLLSIFG